VVDLPAAYAACERLAAAHYENFPVASLLVPRSMRRHIAAVYAFARAADDFADEGPRASDERLRLLDRWLDRLHRCATGHPAPDPIPEEPSDTLGIFVALGATIRDRALPLEPFEDLIAAFRQDVTVTRYPTWEDLLEYSRRSANPVGRLVLRIAGYRDDALDAQSDAICTALQFTNFWQDLRTDFLRGRIYMPQEELRSHRALESDLVNSRLTEPWRQVMAAAVTRTRLLFQRGRPLCDVVTGRLRHELRATWLGGTHILDRLERAEFDPLMSRPRLTPGDVPWFAWRLLTWRTWRTGSAARHSGRP
jgi:squalene synthase HpnC